ncbi:MAG: TadE family type IV pilus minor pilin [Propionibacteriaceae bacterium]
MRKALNKERGMVTAELAVGLLTVIVLATFALWGIALIVQQIRTSDIAAACVRQHARGEKEICQQLLAANPGAHIQIRHNGDMVVADALLCGHSWGALPSITTRATAVAAQEPEH